MNINKYEVEKCILFTEKINTQLIFLIKAYESLPAIVADEHSFIIKNDLPELQKCTLKKEKIAKAVEKHLKELISNTRKLDDITKKYDKEKLTFTFSTRSVLSRINIIIPIINKENNDLKKILELNYKEISSNTDLFDHKMRKYHPMIDMNKYLITNLLQNYRDSYAFWTDMMEVSQASYNETGEQNTKGRNSSFFIKA